MLEERWGIVLRETGFSGLDLSLPDTPDAITHQGTTMISRAGTAAPRPSNNVPVPAQPRAQNFEKLVIIDPNVKTDSDSERVVQQISENDKFRGRVVEVVNFYDLQPDQRICILIELDSSILSDMTEPRLEVLKTLFSKSKGVLWVTKGASDQPTNPNLSLVSGLLRTLRIETGRPLVHLDLDPRSDPKTSANVIAEVYESRFEKDNADSEYITRGDVILIPRHMEDDKTGVHIAARTGNSSPQMDLIPQVGRPLKLQIAQLGLLDTFYYDDYSRGVDNLPDDHVEIEVKAIALNFRDVMMVSCDLFEFYQTSADAQRVLGYGTDRVWGPGL
jgi:hypothetical protein